MLPDTEFHNMSEDLNGSSNRAQVVRRHTWIEEASKLIDSGVGAGLLAILWY